MCMWQWFAVQFNPLHVVLPFFAFVVLSFLLYLS